VPGFHQFGVYRAVGDGIMNPDDLNITVVAVDGDDAVCAIVVRRVEGGFAVQASAQGVSKPSMAKVLRDIADRWELGQ
jgi:hypothetical protein